MNVVDFIRRIKDYGLENEIGRFYGTYMAKVVSNEDPQKRGRIKVSANIFRGSEPQGTDFFIPPKSEFTGENYGIFFPPEKDMFVFLCFIDGDPGRPFYEGGFWTAATAEEDSKGSTPFQEIQTDEPSIRGIRTKYGHQIVMADKTDKNEEPYLEVSSPAGNKIKLNDKDGEEAISIEDKSGNSYISNKDGIIIKDVNGNEIVMAKDGVKVNGQYLVRETFLDWLNSNSSAIGMGNMSAPVPIFPAALRGLQTGVKTPDKFKSDKA